MKSQNSRIVPFLSGVLLSAIFAGIYFSQTLTVSGERRSTGVKAKQPISIHQSNDTLPVIDLTYSIEGGGLKRYVGLRIAYGLIINNGASDNTAKYYLFDREQKKLLKTADVNVLLMELDKLPDQCKIDMIDKCTVPFYSQYGVNIDDEYKRVMDLLKRKQCVLVSSQDDDERHASFCCCVCDYIILDEYKPELKTAGEIVNKLPRIISIANKEKQD